MVEIIIALIGAGASILTAFMSKNTNKKVETIQDIKQDFCKEINAVKYENDKTYLTDFLSEIESGNKKSPIQIKRAYEVYEEYTKLNGNSYIHDKWEELVSNGKL